MTFSALWAEVASNFDTVFGEAFTVTPMVRRVADVNARRIVEPSRPAASFTGVWRDPNFQMYPHSPGHADSSAEKMGGERPRVDFETTALPYKVALGDVITRTVNGKRYEVSDAGDDGFARTTLTLTSAQ